MSPCAESSPDLKSSVTHLTSSSWCANDVRTTVYRPTETVNHVITQNRACQCLYLLVEADTDIKHHISICQYQHAVWHRSSSGCRCQAFQTCPYIPILIKLISTTRNLYLSTRPKMWKEILHGETKNFTSMTNKGNIQKLYSKQPSRQTRLRRLPHTDCLL